MNKNLTQINENYGIVSDEHGNVNIVTKKNAGYELKDILKKENELDEANNMLYNKKNELNHRKLRAIGGEILNIVLVILTISIYLDLRTTSYFLAAIRSAALYYLPLKLLCCGIAGGTRIGRYSKIKHLKKSIAELEEKIPKLEYELTAIKEKVGYNSINNNYSEEAKYKYIPSNTKHCEVPEVIKVHSLMK